MQLLTVAKRFISANLEPVGFKEHYDAHIKPYECVHGAINYVVFITLINNSVYYNFMFNSSVYFSNDSAHKNK